MASSVLSREEGHLLRPAGNAFAKAAQFWKIIEFSCIVVAKIALTFRSFRSRTWAWHYLIYCESKPIVYTAVCFQNYTRAVGSHQKVKNNLGIQGNVKGFRDSTK